MKASPRTVEGIYPAPAKHWVGDGFHVMGYFSAGKDFARKLSPFLLLDYHEPQNYPPTENQRRGVGPHPHRGFETVTLAFAGSVAHQDNAGNGGVIGEGDVQWMTAGSGILHREYHEASYARLGGPFHMMQLWVNLPRAHKMDPPGYQGLSADQMGIVDLPADAGQVRVIAGAYQGAKGPAKTFTPINLFDTTLNARGRVDFSFPERQNTAVLVMKGAVTINGAHQANINDFVIFNNEGEHISIDALSDARFVLLNGDPIDEPVVQYGPFVMNTRQEIEEAVSDYNLGKFGRLEP